MNVAKVSPKQHNFYVVGLTGGLKNRASWDQKTQTDAITYARYWLSSHPDRSKLTAQERKDYDHLLQVLDRPNSTITPAPAPAAAEPAPAIAAPAAWPEPEDVTPVYDAGYRGRLLNAVTHVIVLAAPAGDPNEPDAKIRLCFGPGDRSHFEVHLDGQRHTMNCGQNVRGGLEDEIAHIAATALVAVKSQVGLRLGNKYHVMAGPAPGKAAAEVKALPDHDGAGWPGPKEPSKSSRPGA